jgi:putative selenate reductase
VILEELASPSRIILEEDRVTALECVRNELGEPGPDGRRRPIPIVGSEFQIEADSIVIAIGQVLEACPEPGRRVGDRIVVDPLTQATSVPGVFAGGDAVRGPATIVEACADGRRAAQAICQQLGVPFERPSVHLPVLSEEEIVQVKRARARKAAQHEAAMLPPDQRSGFDLVEATLTEEAALAEGARCLQCSTLCDKCVEVCPNRANYNFSVMPVSLTLPKVSCQQGQLVVKGEEVFTIEQTRQIIHIDDFCNECGNCETFCVHHGKPYLDKPRLFLRESDFEQEENNAFYVERGTEGWTIRRREGGKESRLSVENGNDEVNFENDLLRMRISSADFQIKAMEMKRGFRDEFSLAGPAEMVVILKGLLTSLPFLPFEET